MIEDRDPSRGLSLDELIEAVDPETGMHVDATRQAAGSIGNQLFAARTRAGLSQVRLAELSGVRQSDISDIENGRGNPTRRTLEKLGVALQIDFAVGKSSAA